jgi:putative membrane protein
MYIRWVVAALHLLALGIGLGAIWWRGLSLRGELTGDSIKRVLYADNLWGFAALLWISTGLARAFAGLEKGSAYYLSNEAFWIKMALLVIILLLEIWPASTWVKWRIRMARGEQVQIDPDRKRLFSNISFIQSALIVGMVFAATAMARGLGF